MKTPDTHENLHRFVDDAMSDTERAAFLAEMEKNLVLAGEVAKLKTVSGLIKNHLKMERAVPNADFFNSQIMDRVAAEQRAGERTRARSGASWLGWFFRPWALAGMTAAIALGVFAFNEIFDSPKTEVVNTFTPDPSVKASSSYNKDADATILKLDGLAEMPDDHDLSILRARSEAKYLVASN
jgi:hypothetical protein